MTLAAGNADTLQTSVTFSPSATDKGFFVESAWLIEGATEIYKILI